MVSGVSHGLLGGRPCSNSKYAEDGSGFEFDDDDVDEVAFVAAVGVVSVADAIAEGVGDDPDCCLVDGRGGFGGGPP
jgi:hypothetical protein